MHAQLERGVTASPESPIHKIPSGSLRTELPHESLRGTGLEDRPQGEASPRRTRLQLWMHRVLILLFVFFCAAIGVLLVILPWRPEWTDNYLLLSFPSLRSLVSNGFFRGFCSGLGLLDIWIGFWEALHYHEQQ